MGGLLCDHAHGILTFMTVPMKYLAVIVFLLALPYASQAHETEVDGSVSAVLHMTPNHTPAPAELANIFFYFKDTAKPFIKSEYALKLEVEKEGALLSEIPLSTTQNTPVTEVDTSYIFPSAGEYTLTLIGTHADDGDPAFTLHYPVTVSTSSSQWIPIHLLHTHGLHILLITLLTLILTGFVGAEKYKNRKSR